MLRSSAGGMRLPLRSPPANGSRNLSDRGPGSLPLDDVRGYGPQLTMLSILTGDLDLNDHVDRVLALVVIAQAPEELRAGYTRILRAVVPPSARAALEALMMDHLKDDFVDGFIAQGEAQMLLRIMTARGIAIPDDVRILVTKCADTARLEAWADHAATATAIGQIFTDEDRSAAPQKNAIPA